MKFKDNYKNTLLLVGSIAGGLLLELGIEKIFSYRTRYDVDGYDKYGFNRDGFNRLGFDVNGYNTLGYDKDGFDRFGFSADGYNRNGRDRSGYDRNGYDENGFDRYGKDSEGYKRNGFNSEGFNRDGYDYQGYARNRYNHQGIDRAGKCRQHYSHCLEQLHIFLDQAHHQIYKNEYRYALYEIRIILEETIKLIVQHNVGYENIGDCLLANLKICERNNLLDSTFIDKLHGIRKLCNANGHKLFIEKNLSYETVVYAATQIELLLSTAKALLVHI